MIRGLLLFLLALPIFAQAQFNAFINLGVEDGLAQSQVIDVHQSKEGYLWVATASGLSRYDGSDFVNFYKSDGLVDNMVTSIYEDDSGRIYFGGIGGLSIYEEGEFRAIPFPRSMYDSRVQHMMMGEAGSLWVGTNRDGLCALDLGTEKYSPPNTSMGVNIRCFDIDRAWVGGRSGLFNYGVLADSIFHQRSVTDVIFDEDRIYVSTLGSWIHLYEDGQWRVLDTGVPEESKFIRDMHLDATGALWAVGQDGVLRWDEGYWEYFGEGAGLSFNNFRHVDEDREGNIWVSSNGGGLFRYTGDIFQNYVSGNPLLKDLMLSTVETEHGLFQGMFDAGLQVIRPDGRVELIESIPAFDVWSLLQDSDGVIWAGTSNGLYRSEDGERFLRMYQEELPNQRVTALAEDDMGNIWVGHRDGAMVIYSDAEFGHLVQETGFDGKRIRDITQSVDGAMWLGAQNGLFRVEDQWILHLDEEDGLNDHTIYSIQSDDLGRLWIGAKNGLHILMDDSVYQVELSGRVDANNINFLHCSSQGQIYAGTNQGVYHARIAEEVNTMSFERIGIDQGLLGLECNLNSVAEMSSGDIWFGTSTGVVRFSEEKLLAQEPPGQPSLMIKDVLLFAEPFDKASRQKGISASSDLDYLFKPDENHVTISFKGIRLKDPYQIRYRYMLEGADSDWLPAREASSVTFSSLSFGTYCFRVQCVNLLGTPLGEELQLNFRILAPIYLRWWALLIQFALLGLIVYAIYRWRVKVRSRKTHLIELGYRNRMQSLERASLNSSMNRHFIFNSLNAIQFYINKEDKRSANRYLSSFAKLIRKNLDSTNLAWVSLHDELERLDLYLRLEHMRFKDKFEYEVKVDETVDTSAVNVPSMMLQPFVENSIWHGLLPKQSAGRVEVAVSLNEGRLRIRIEDDGIGIEQSRANKSGVLPDHESKGMDITNHRLRLYSEMTGVDFDVIGPIQVEENGEVLGTRIDLFIPFVN